MEIVFPTPTLPLCQVFAPGFTAPSFASFQSSGWALMVVEGRTCLTRIARCVCFPQRDRSRGERCLAAHRWSLTTSTARLVTLVVAQLGAQRQVPGASWLGTATPLVAKTATRMGGGQTWQAQSDHADRGASLVGHPWHLVGLLRPWGTRWRCWPLVRRLVPGLHGARQGLVGATVEPMRFWAAALAATLEGTRCWGDAAARGVAAASSSQAPFRNGLRARGLAVISRLRQDAGGGEEPAPRPPGTRGRQPRDGRQWPLASLVPAETPTRAGLPLEGTLPEVVCVVRDGWRRDVAQKVRGVGVAGAKEPLLLVSTALALTALQSIAIDGARCAMARTIRDVQQHCGLGDSQGTTTLAILRFGPLACLALCRWRLALLEHRAAGWLHVTASRVSLPEAPLRCQRVRRALRAWATRQIIVANATPGADVEKSERDHEPLLQMLV